MGYNLHAICNTHSEHAYISRGDESVAIAMFMRRHSDRICRVEWAVDNTYSTPYWADKDSDLHLPDDLRESAKAKESHGD
jgi:pimeloyl-CoA synthetase